MLMADESQAPPSARREARPWMPAALLLLVGVGAVGVFTVDSQPLRDLAGVIVVVSPGFAIAPLLRIDDRGFATLIALLASATCLICVAQTVTYVAFFSWQPCLRSLNCRPTRSS